jgi:hypothetical protein
MSTLIETNTEELQEILKTVNNLPNAGGGFSIPVIDLVAFGFPIIGESENYEEVVMFDQITWETIKSAMESGAVKVRFALNDYTTAMTTFLCEITESVESPTQRECYGNWGGNASLRLVLSPGDGTYGLVFSIHVN